LSLLLRKFTLMVCSMSRCSIKAMTQLQNPAPLEFWNVIAGETWGAMPETARPTD
jgi:hypothetical protein